jgi:oligo-1,6-glucosidase
VVYQIYPRSFADSDGDGIGDLRGIIARLDHLAGSASTSSGSRPIYPSPQDDAGYDISDYEDIDPLFGTLGDFDALLAALHERGMKLVMDLVVNHTSTSTRGSSSRARPGSPKRDWYWWRPPRRAWSRAARARSRPTGVVLLGPAWELDEASGEYYLHLFSRKQPDLNWENPQVRAAVYAMMRWWLDRGVDGFRMDVINIISKDARRCPTGPCRRRRAVRRRLAALHLRAAHPRVPAGDAPRGVRRPRRRCSPSARCRRDRRAGRAVHRPGRGRGRHGLPVRARGARPGRDQVGRAAAR